MHSTLDDASASAPATSFAFPWLVGALGATLGALAFAVPWVIAVVGVPVIFALSALEYEFFLLFVLFLLPVGWLLNTGTVIHDVMTAVRVLLAAGFFAGRLSRGRMELRRLLRPFASRVSLGFVGVALLSVFFGTAGWTHNSARSLALLISSLLFYFVVLAWADSSQRIRKVLKVLLWSTIVTSVFAIVQTIAGGYTPLWLYLYPPDENFTEWSWRATSFLNYPNSLAGYLNLLLPFALACYALGDGAWKRLGRWATITGFVALVLTQSRAGIATFGCVLIAGIFLLVESWGRRLLLLGGYVAFVLIFFAAGAIVSSTRLGDIDTADTLLRPILWVTAWNFFSAAPFLGTGLGNFPILYGSYVQSGLIRPDYLTVNNLYLEVLSETGIVGFGFFYTLVVVAVRRAYLRFRGTACSFSRILGFGLFGAMITILVHGTLDLTLDVSPQFDALFWLILALFAADGQLRAPEPSESSIRLTQSLSSVKLEPLGYS